MDSKDVSKNAIYVIDGSSFLFRAYYALKPMHTPSGIPSQAIYGFCRMIKKVIDDFNPKYLVVLWDVRGKNFRKEIYEGYKAKRQTPPSDLSVQKENIIKFLDTINLCQDHKQGYEADDLIASVVEENKRRDVVIIASDKDLFQLIGNHVFMFDPFKKQLINEKDFIKLKGFAPSELLLYHSLLGDASDNIPGVAGIGKVTAEKLVKQFKTLDRLYKNIDEIENKRIRTILEDHKEDAYLSQKLFTLKTPKLNKSLDDFLLNKEDWANARDLFVEWGFKSLSRGIKQTLVTVADSSVKDLNVDWKCIIIQEEKALQDLISLLKKAKSFAMDVETSGLDVLTTDLVGLSFAFDKKVGYYIPLAHKEGIQLNRDYVLDELRPILESDKYKKTLHNSKFDKLVLYNHGLDLNGIDFDSLLAANLVRLAWQKIGLKSLSELYFNERMQTYAEVAAKKKSFAEVSIADGGKYSAHDSIQTYKLKLLLEKKINALSKIKKLFYDVEMPLCDILCRMEIYGISVKPEILDDIGVDVEKDLKVIKSKIFGSLKITDINLNSPKQIEKLLFDELKLPVVKKSSEGKRSTDQFVLEELSKVHPIPGLILKYRELFKLLNTYIIPLKKYINPDGRIHTNYSQIDVSTGRLSSYNPNLQNIPVGEGYGLRVRSAFVAPRGKIFLSADYSQIDLRVLAHFTKDKNLITAFKNNHDIHAETAAKIFNVNSRPICLSKVTKKQRQVGKRINFSIIYGLTPYGLSRDLGITPSEAKDYINQYFDQYPNVAKWMEKTIIDAKKNGYVETYLGRRRYFPGLKEKNRTVYEQARRAAINTPIQGSAADIVKVAMIHLDKEIKKENLEARMILQIHDEIVLELPKKEEDKVKKLVKNVLEKVVDWEIPFKVDIRTGKNWEDITK